jgi:hypothetical protein
MMIMLPDPAGAVIDQVSRDNKDNGERQQPVLVIVPYLLGHQEKYASGKHQERQVVVVMLPEPMPQRIRSDCKSQCDHKVFKANVIYNIYSE